MTETDFNGTKIALLNDRRVLAIQRDDKPDISYPGLWDLPGGAREAGETPMEVAVREVKEELGVDLQPTEVVWQKTYPSVIDIGKKAIFMVFAITDDQVQAIRFGDEGKGWKMMAFDEFLSHGEAVPGMQERLNDYLVFAHHLR